MIRSRLTVTKSTALTTRGLVTAEHPLGAEVGASILARGGNAVDAAVATAFAMPVVEPFMSTVAGSGTMLVHLAKPGETVCLDFNGVAPMAAHGSMYRLIGGIATYALFAWPRVEGDANVYGYRSVAVPGSVAGLTLALERFGTMTLADVVAPAVRLAREGFIADWYQALNTAKYLEELSAFPETARVHLRNGRSVYRPPSMEPGDRVTNPDLAASMELIGRDGAEAFYRGAIAQAIHNDMAAHDGLITKDDLAAYRPRVVAPLRGRYRDLDLALSPGATGGTTALEMLNILEQFAPAACGFGTAAGLHVRAEAARRAFADRFAHLGDTEVVGDAPFERLTSKDYAREVARDIRPAGSAPAGGLHDPRLGRRSGSQHGVAHQYRRVLVGSAGRGAGNRDSPQQRDDLVRSRAGKAELRGAGQARDGEHGSRARVQEGASVSRARRPRWAEDRGRDPAGRRQPRRHQAVAAGGHRRAAAAP